MCTFSEAGLPSRSSTRSAISATGMSTPVASDPGVTSCPGPPGGQLGDLRGRADVTVDLTEPLLDVHLQRGRLAEQVEHPVGDLRDGDVDARGDVQHLAGDAVDRRLDDR